MQPDRPPDADVRPVCPPDTRAGGHETAGPSPPVRAVLIIVGTTTLALGVIGIVVPVLPTTPFLLVTAACYARASTRLYERLLGQPSLGPLVAEWRRSRQLPPGVKTRALIAVALTFAVSIVLVGNLVMTLLLVVIGGILAVFLWRIPTAQPDRD